MVSIIVPAYNHAVYLTFTLQSILAQTYTNWEAIVVDDESTDNTSEVVAQFADPRIRYIWQKNLGMAGARNTGIHAARGEFISFLDDDDMWYPDYLSSVTTKLLEYPDAGACYTGSQMVDSDGLPLYQQNTKVVLPVQMFDSLIERGFFPPCSVTVRRTCFENLGVFDQNLQGYADWDMWLRIVQEYQFIGVPQVLVKYRIHSGGLSSNIQHMFTDNLKAVEKHFGPQEGLIQSWPALRRRAYGYAYLTAALGYIAENETDEGWRYLTQAVILYPAILQRLDTFYELALGNQARGCRGQVDLLDIQANGTDMLGRLDGLLTSALPDAQAMRGPAFGNAYLALAMLSDQDGQWGEARRYLLRAIQYQPALLRQTSVIRRLAKLLLGSRLTAQLRSATSTGEA